MHEHPMRPTLHGGAQPCLRKHDWNPSALIKIDVAVVQMPDRVIPMIVTSTVGQLLPSRVNAGELATINFRQPLSTIETTLKKHSQSRFVALPIVINLKTSQD